MDCMYYLIPSYTMKCRLYPNKAQAQAIDDAIYAVQSYHNCVVWKIFNEFSGTTAKPFTPKKNDAYDDTDNHSIKPGDTVHFINLKGLFTSEFKQKLTEEHPVIEKAPAGAITTNNGLIADLKREFDLTHNKKPVEFRKPIYYNKAHPRRSYTYQESVGKISSGDNPKVIFINLNKIGKVKIRGWNSKISFNETGTMDLVSYAQSHHSANVTVTISKDTCGDYWICFKLNNVFKLMPVPSENAMVGVDAGISDIAILSNGKKYKNHKYKKQAARHKKALNRRLSRRKGWSNISFREEHKRNPELSVSKGYIKAQSLMSRLERKVARRRTWYNNQISYEIIHDNCFVGVESMNVKGMFRNRHLSFALSDAAMSQLLSMISYKGKWYERTVQPIDQWTPSSKRCSSCKDYIKEDLKLSIRKWDCPVCGAHHDRDINAAKNILDFALITYKEQVDA